MAIVRNARDICDLNCSLCEENFKNPKVLPCLHSFCQSCLDATIRGQERVLICPTCSIDIPIPTKGMDAFPTNSFINNMLNILAVQNPTNCTNCEDRELATSRCLDCVENLCQNCVTAHERIRQTKGHNIISFEELQNNAVHDAIKCPSFCKVHDREMLKYFCESCDDAICRDCAIYEHREHHYLDLKEAVKSHREGVTNLLDNSKRKIPVIKLALKEITEVAESLRERKNSVANVINETVDCHVKKLEEKRVELLDRLQHTFIEKEAVLKEQHLSLEMDLNNLLTGSEFVEFMMRYGNEAEIMMVKKLMVSRLTELNNSQPQLEPEENDIVEFFSQDEALKSVIQKFGILSTSDTFPPLCVAVGTGVTAAKLNHYTEFTLMAKDRFDNPIGRGGDYVIAKLTDGKGLTTNVDVKDCQNGSYTIGYTVQSKEKHTLSVYVREKPIHDSPFEVNVIAGIDCEKIGPMLTQFGSGGVISSVKNNDNYEPWGVVCDKDGNILVTDHNNHKVLTFDVNGKLLSQFGVRGKDDGEMWYPTGVAVDKQLNIYVADHGNHRIQTYTKDGQFIRKFGTRGTTEGLLKGPCGIAIDQENRLIVADRDNHRIQVFDLKGNFLFIFGGSGSADGKFNSPRHVAITTENHILVSDTNNYRVQKFDQNGKFLSKFGTKGAQDGQFLCPSGLGTDSENNIVVSDFKNIDAQLFSSDGQFIKKLGATVKQLSKPTGVFITSHGNVLVADRGTHKIHMY
ncbi:E3 ubiquitin-protein ligase TRIM71-like [Hydractinia symbiolongicarpus]|uniref:E3 ubiquitin-protein ligase TRIM71-like n=1 Tax=Hydractinia symbiolongicarpus TaxID=13093 RepID=UPI00254C8528|nr:E3 ubiquitin-protein ligase TRIM71-like [Hydractinia symbiolongicarpus]